MTNFGIQLRKQREQRGLRLVDVARIIKVGAHHLAAIEYDDFDALPENGLAKKYVRKYAKCLELDPDATVAEFAAALEKGRPPGSFTPAAGDAGAGRGGLLARVMRVAPGHLVIVGALIVVLVLIGWWWSGGDAAREEAPPQVEPPAMAAETPVEAGADSEPEPPLPVEPEAIDVETVAPQPAAHSEPQPESESELGPVTLTIVDHGVGTGVSERMLVGRSDRFAEGRRVWFWTRVQGGSAGDTIRHVWIHDGREEADVSLRLGGWHWRTQSRKTLTPGSLGPWVVEARDSAGRLLARSEFTCVPPAEL
jgi:cytoskeletal protein RodZ